MCLNSTHFFPKRAKEDIEVYKRCIPHQKHLGFELHSWYFDYRYSKVEVASINASFQIDFLRYHMPKLGFLINEGLHAYINSRFFCNTVWKIPKGTKYFLGEHDEIVAEKLIFIRCTGRLKGKDELVIWK